MQLIAGSGSHNIIVFTIKGLIMYYLNNMVTHILLIIFSLANGGWMLFDGIHMLQHGKYFGPEKPGPWSNLVTSIGFNPFSFGPVFIALGILWLFFLCALYFTRDTWAWYGLLATAIATLWYLPVGTILSVGIILILIMTRSTLIQ